MFFKLYVAAYGMDALLRCDVNSWLQLEHISKSFATMHALEHNAKLDGLNNFS